MRQRTDGDRLTRFLQALGRRMRRPVRFYLVGGSVLIDLGLRGSTLDIYDVAAADDVSAVDKLEIAIRQLKSGNCQGRPWIGSSKLFPYLRCNGGSCQAPRGAKHLLRAVLA